MSGEHHLSRFTKAQTFVYDSALDELTSGQKYSHWMWFIFPQIEGLGRSDTARYYAIKNREEARQYLEHPVLGERLIECTKTVLSVHGRSAAQIFGYPDELKFRSSMTLFAEVSASDSVFEQALDKYFDGQKDPKTLERLMSP